MPSLVAIDCTGQGCSVALLHEGRVIARHSPPGGRQSEHLLRWLEQVLAEAGLPGTAVDGLAVAIGPGGFTGVRLAVAAIQGLALAWERPVVPVSSLAALAYRVLDANAAEPAPASARPPVLAVLDARMDEVYAGWFAPVRADAWPQPLAAEAVLAPEQLVFPDSLAGHDSGAGTAPGYVAIGSGMQVHGARIAARLGTPQQVLPIPEPDAAAVVALAALAWPRAVRPAHLLQPAYLRNKVALTTAERQAQG